MGLQGSDFCKENSPHSFPQEGKALGLVAKFDHNQALGNLQNRERLGGPTVILFI